MLVLLLTLCGLAGPPDGDADGYPATIDCNDAVDSVHPLATEVPYDGVDQNCTGADQCDVDGDGSLATQCGGPDCADDDPSRRPGAVDIPGDGIDQDCDGADAVPRCDLDADGALAPGCGGADCDDLDASIHPLAIDLPNDGIDQDCDGQDNCPKELWYGGGTCSSMPEQGALLLIFGALGLALMRRRRRR